MPSVKVSKIIDEPADEVWSLVRDFSTADQWHPYVTECEMEQGTGESVGAIRRDITPIDGEEFEFRIQVVEMSDRRRSRKYRVVDSGPLPFENYVAGPRFIEVTESNQTLALWRANYDVDPGQAEAINQTLVEIFRGACRGIEESLQGR